MEGLVQEIKKFCQNFSAPVNANLQYADHQLKLLAGKVQEHAALIIYDPRAHAHKYIFAIGSEQDFVCAMPLTLIELHKEILALLKYISGAEELYCPGGGYLDYKAGKLLIHGASTDFGPGDHELALGLFQGLLILNNTEQL